MKKLLLLFASLTLSAPAANAESIWMVLAGGRIGKQSSAASMVKIEMTSMESCQRQGKELKASREFRVGVFDYVNYACIRGK